MPVTAITDSCRVLLVDGQPVVRGGLRHFLLPHSRFQVCGEAGDGADAIRKCAELLPDIVIMDLYLPTMDGAVVARELLEANPKLEILVFAKADSEQVLTRVFAAGAHAYVSKEEALEVLVTALDSLRRGVPSIPASLVERLGMAKPKRRGQALDFDVLTPREREVARILAEGKSNKEAAVVLGISVKTAETHRSRIMRKLKLRSFADLVHYALRNHYLEINGQF